MKFYLVTSLAYENTYFIFREIDARNCLEITVKIRNNLILPNHNLKPEESNYIRENILQKGDVRIK